MTNHALATVTIDHINGIAKDRVVNTFPMDLDPAAALSVKGPGILACLASFYNDVQTSGVSVAAYLSHGLSRAVGGSVVRLYDIDGNEDGTPHGSPLYVGAFQLGAVMASTSPLPEEVAMAITTRGVGWAAYPVEAPDGSDPGGAIDRPRQRASGRIFIGPLNNGCNTPVSSIARPAPAFRTTLLDAAEGLQDDLGAIGVRWSVWSRANAMFSDVTDVQVDDAFDTQRRRGAAPTARTTRNIL